MEGIKFKLIRLILKPGRRTVNKTGDVHLT